ncbi:MAG: glycosyltransferase family 4 protein [Armatimonadota bacterium]
MDVAIFVRKPSPRHFSLEHVCADIVGAMTTSVIPRIVVMPCQTRGLRGMLRNMAYARSRAGAVNHVFGDIHYIACSLPAGRTILTVADCTTLIHRVGLRRAVLRYLWYTWPISHCALVTTISESTRQELLNLVSCPPEKVRVVHVPVSSSFTFSPKEFNHECPTILQVGTRENKNLLRVILAVMGVPCHLRIIGVLSEQQKTALEQLGIRYSSVANIPDTQLTKEYRDCDMVVFASTYEGFGLPIVEAQASGRPVITSNLCSMPEVAGDAACLVDPFDVDSIKTGILHIISDATYRAELVERGLINIERFRPEAIATQYTSLYQELWGTAQSRRTGRANATSPKNES